MKFSTPFLVLLAATSGYTRSIPTKRGLMDLIRIKKCADSVESEGCPVLDLIGNTDDMDAVCKIFNNNTCQKIYKHGIKSFHGCENLSDSLVETYQGKINRKWESVEKACSPKSTTTTEKPKPTPTTSKKPTTAAQKTTSVQPQPKPTQTNNVVKTTTTTTTVASATSVTTLAPSVAVPTTATSGLPTPTPTGAIIGDETSDAPSRYGNVLIATFGLLFYALF